MALNFKTSLPDPVTPCWPVPVHQGSLMPTPPWEYACPVRIKGLVVYLTLNEDHVAFNENESYNQ